MKKLLPFVKTFSATKHEDRNELGERATKFLRDLQGLVHYELRTHQSSDESFHCLSLIAVGAVEVDAPDPKAVTS